MTYEEVLAKYAQRFAKGKVIPSSVRLAVHSDQGSGCNTCDYGAEGTWIEMNWKVSAPRKGHDRYQSKKLGDDVVRVLIDLLEIANG